MFPMYILKKSAFTAVLCCLFLVILFSSCGTTRPYTYMQGQFDTVKLSQVPPLGDPIIRKGDLLSIIVYSDNPAFTAIYNQPVTGGSGSAAPQVSGGGGSDAGGGGGSVTSGISTPAGGSPGSGGYLVDEQGNIEFQGVGLLHVEGLSRSILKDTLSNRLREYLKNPYFTIRFLNYRFTMLGEISRPGIFNIPNEHINLLEAIGLGGDLTFYGRRDNVLVIRENNGKREYGRLDLTKPEVMASPYFYLQPNDVVYIEQSKKKIAANDQVTQRNLALIVSLISVTAILYNIFKK
jgi:polysaccharide export outer membrane protein